ncbi:MAG: glycosyltransferase family 2 protein [Gammaproteobacteria bacterium]|nr:glycosyltransferase family 2 protein [Gammaproteobacteria bacterium]
MGKPDLIMSNTSEPQSALKLGLVVPCFNEEQVLPQSVAKLHAELERLIDAGNIRPDSKIYLVDDGSSDATWQRIESFVDAGLPVVGLKLTRNFGHQHALYAGLMEAEGDALISLDADLQDDISAMEEMLDALGKGSDSVFAVREDRSKDTVFKRWTAAAHYGLSAAMGIETVKNHADYRLLSRRAVELLREYRETNLYLRGIIPQLGLPASQVYFRRGERPAGKSKYNFWRMLSLSIKGVTSFSIAPLRMIAVMGLLIFTVSMALVAWVLYAAFFIDEIIPGWASTVLPMYLLGGFQLLAIGIAGEYIGKTYMEVKRRPLYHLERKLSAAEQTAAANNSGD